MYSGDASTRTLIAMLKAKSAAKPWVHAASASFSGGAATLPRAGFLTPVDGVVPHAAGPQPCAGPQSALFLRRKIAITLPLVEDQMLRVERRDLGRHRLIVRRAEVEDLAQQGR